MSADMLQDLMTRAEALSADEKLRLAIYLLEQTRLGELRSGNKWRDIRGLLPDPLEGEDAQEWVSRSRRESTEHREALLRR